MHPRKSGKQREKPKIQIGKTKAQLTATNECHPIFHPGDDGSVCQGLDGNALPFHLIPFAVVDFPSTQHQDQDRPAAAEPRVQIEKNLRKARHLQAKFIAPNRVIISIEQPEWSKTKEESKNDLEVHDHTLARESTFRCCTEGCWS